MCIICYIPEKVQLPSDEILSRCWDNNPDGGGFMWIQDGEVRTFKTMVKSSWLDQLKRLRGETTSPIVFHTRRATHGVVNLANTHPFVIDKKMAMVHNGHISPCSTSAKAEQSDTSKFVSDIIIPMKELVFDDGINFLLEEYIGKSKLVFLSATDGVKIVNEDSGTWDKGLGCWFSNLGYQAPKTVVEIGTSHKSGTVVTTTWAYKEHACPCCSKVVYASYTLMLGFGSLPHFVRVECCYSCRKDFLMSVGWSKDALLKVVQSCDCGYCGKSVWASSSNKDPDVFYFDIESNDYVRVCNPCYRDILTNQKMTDSIWNCKTFEQGVNVLSVLNSNEFERLIK